MKLRIIVGCLSFIVTTQAAFPYPSCWRSSEEVEHTKRPFSFSAESLSFNGTSFDQVATVELHTLLSDVLASRGIKLTRNSLSSERSYSCTKETSVSLRQRHQDERSPLVQKIVELRSRPVDVNQKINGYSIATLITHITDPEIQQALIPFLQGHRS